MLIEAHFDESSTHQGSPVMCVAGYLFERTRSEAMAQEWRDFIADKGVPFIHMADCAPGNPPFDALTKPQRILLASRMIGLIKQHTIQGLGVTLDLIAFHKRFGEESFLGTPYSLSLYLIVRAIVKWADETHYDGEIAYFFEAGHASQREANDLMSIAINTPAIRAEMRYASHAFVEKKKTPQVQAADLFAWQLTKDIKSSAEGRRRRADYASLLLHHHTVINIGDEAFDILEPLWNTQRKQLIRSLEAHGISVTSGVSITSGMP